MTEPDLAPDATVWRAVSSDRRSMLHTRRNCPALQKANKVESKPLRTHPHPTWCSICTGDGPAAGGGSREIYERAKRIGQQRSEAVDD